LVVGTCSYVVNYGLGSFEATKDLPNRGTVATGACASLYAALYAAYKYEEMEKSQEKPKVEEKQKSSVAKEEMLVNVLAYFLGEPKKIKDAAIALDLQYQKVRYSLFLIRDRGLNGDTYNLVETEIDGSKAFQLQKK